MPVPPSRFWSSRLHLARLERSEFVALLPPVLFVTAVFLLFQFLGTGRYSYSTSNSAWKWMVQNWSSGGIAMGSGDYSHGFLVPLASLWLVWRKRDEWVLVPKRRSLAGLIGVVASLFLHYVGYKTQQTRLSLLAIIGLTWTVPFYLHGWEVAKRLIFPCAFLVFAVPLNFLEGLQFPLRMVNTRLSVLVLNGLGIEVRSVGTAIYGPPFDMSAKLRLEVADPCSGIRSLTAMMALTAVYGYVVMRGFWRKWLLFLCSIPLAMSGNLVRIVSIGVLSAAFDSDMAAGLPHDYAGFIVFGMAITLMVALASFLNLAPRTIPAPWRKQASSTPM